MTPAHDFGICFHDFTNEQILTAGAKIGELLTGLPLEDSFHRNLAEDLAQDIAILTRILEQSLTQGLTFSTDDLEHERELLLSGLTQTIRAACRHPFEAKAEAARRLCLIMERRGLALRQLVLENPSAELELLIAEFDHAPVQMDLAALDLAIWYKRLKSSHAQYREAVKEESAASADRSLPLPSMNEITARIAWMLELIRQGIGHQARKGRAPYDRLATQIDEAVNGIGSVSLRRSTRNDRAPNGNREEAALSS